MEENYTDDVHWLPEESLRGAWEALCRKLASTGSLRAAEADLRPGGLAHIHLADAADHYHEIDRSVMSCLAVDPLYRRDVGTNEMEIVMRFRTWWRESVPFLMDPDGPTDHYVFERVPASSVPPPPDEPWE